MDVDVQVEAFIRRPPAVVAAYAADPDNAPHWYSNIVSVRWQTVPPVQVGSQVDFKARFMGRRLAYTYDVVEFEPGQKIVMRTALSAFPMETTYSWEATLGGTVMKLRNRGTPTGFGKVTRPLTELAMRRAMTKDLARLAAVLEAADETD